MSTEGAPTVEGLLIDRSTPTWRVTFDRPARRNALTDAMVDALCALLEDAAADDGVRAILVTANGDDFCSGFDLAGRPPPDPDHRPRTGATQRRLPGRAHRLLPLLLTTQVPVVVGVRGVAAGIGLHVALAADVAVVADDARLHEPFADRGFTPDSAGTWLLPRLVGVARAKSMLLLGRAVDGATAAAWGLVHEAVPAAEVDGAAAAIAAELAAGPSVALGLTKALVHEGLTAPLEAHLAREALALELSSRSPDFAEGMRARRDKRPPEYGGR